MNAANNALDREIQKLRVLCSSDLEPENEEAKALNDLIDHESAEESLDQIKRETRKKNYLLSGILVVLSLDLCLHWFG